MMFILLRQFRQLFINSLLAPTRKQLLEVCIIINNNIVLLFLSVTKAEQSTYYFRLLHFSQISLWAITPNEWNPQPEYRKYESKILHHILQKWKWEYHFGFTDWFFWGVSFFPIFLGSRDRIQCWQYQPLVETAA